MNNYWQNKKVLITGANGFIGSNAVRFFSNLGAEVTAVVHNNQDNLHTNNIKVVKANLLDPEQAKSITSGKDIILNFAALDGSALYKKEHSAEIFSANIRITLNMLEALSQNPDAVFLLVSSADIYPPTTKPITESTPMKLDWDQKVDGYKLAKWVSELAAREFINQYNLKTVIVRPSNVYGPQDLFEDDERLRFIPSLIKKSYNQKPISIWGSGKQSRAFLYVDDFLLYCQKLIEKKVYNTPVNIAGTQELSLREMANLVTELTDQKTKIQNENDKPEGQSKRSFNLKKLIKYLGPITETPYREGLRQTISYYLKFHHKNAA